MFSYKRTNEDMDIIAVSRDLEDSDNSRLVYFSPTEDGSVKLDELDNTTRYEYLALFHQKDHLRSGPYRQKVSAGKKVTLLTPHNKNSVFVPLYIRDQRTVYYICGQSGAGKSVLAQTICEYLAKIQPCFLVTTVPDSRYEATMLDVKQLVQKNDDADETAYKHAKIVFKNKKKHMTDEQKIEMEMAIDRLKPKVGADEYKLTESYWEIIHNTKTLTSNAEERSLFIYDDCEVHPDTNKLRFIQDTQLVNGRHNGITMCILNHLTNNGLRTKLQISESHVFVIFRPLSKYVKYFLEQYMDFNPDMMKCVRIMLENSRYAAIYPQLKVILSQQMILKYD